MKTPQIALLLTLAALGGASANDLDDWYEKRNEQEKESQRQQNAEWQRKMEDQRKDMDHKREVQQMEYEVRRAKMDNGSSGSPYYGDEKAPKKRIQTVERQKQLQQSQTNSREEQRLLALVLDEDIKTANASAYKNLLGASMSEGTRARLVREFLLNLGRIQDQRNQQVQRDNAGSPQRETAQKQPQDETTDSALDKENEVTPQKIAEWRIAANKGDAEAQTKLGACYSDGLCVSKDYVLAYMWLNLASAAIPDIAEIRDDVEKMMTPAQVAEGQKLSREWKPKN